MKNSNVTFSFGIIDIVQIIFIVCKLVSIQPITNWSWWLVFSPILGFLAFLIAIVIFIVAIEWIKLFCLYVYLKFNKTEK
jgi:ABC-type antimicrobial peptide transport system permease subunit